MSHPRRRSLSKWRRVEPHRPRESWWTRPLDELPGWLVAVMLLLVLLIAMPLTLAELAMRGMERIRG